LNFFDKLPLSDGNKIPLVTKKRGRVICFWKAFDIFFWKALIKGFPKSYDTAFCFNNQKISVAIGQKGVCQMAIEKKWLPFDITPPLDGDQRISAIIHHTDTIRWRLKVFDCRTKKVKVEFFFPK
jgi:hypothetical protein